MDGLHTRWDRRTTDQWLAARFDKMGRRFGHHPALNASFASLADDARSRAMSAPVPSVEEYDWSRIRRTEMKSFTKSDLDYFRLRAAGERAAAEGAQDIRVRQVHLEMAERYQALIGVCETPSELGLHLVF